MLNYYDVEEVKAFLLKLLIEVEELRGDVAFEREQAQKWYARYRDAIREKEGTTNE